MLTLTIRPETPEDIPFIDHVHEQAFPRDNEARLVDLLRAANKASVSLVALTDDQIVGHVLFSPVTFVPEQPTVRGLGLAPVAVLPEFQNQGIGGKLILEGLRVCKQNGYDLSVVLGSPRYYSRFGFSRAGDYGLDNEYGASDDFMAMEFRAGVLGTVKGLVKYQPEFMEADC
jgi:putative acetyltransferase